ncbi:hypothetical protein Trco_002354 [Trichoderma cornu-damae]|uniref:PARP catalytic domain-containing protein n=1 Tax=Trichoderma cornu-damae TaxID=654480 RepID=A0A9P8TXY1_9HYPO|nr:hypothetical protein Trco_002354 [Trichoderma cornu-damae]
MCVSNLIDKHLPPSVITWSQDTSEELNEHTLQFQFSDFTFRLCLSADRRHLLSSSVLDTNSSIPRRVLDPLRQRVRSIFLALYRDEDEHESSRVKDGDLQVAVLQALEHLSEFLATAKMTPAHGSKGFSASEVSSWEDVVSNPIGLDVSTIRDTASFLLGMTPEQIAQQIPKAWRIMHMESVLREDLLRRFRRHQGHLRASLQGQPDLRKKLAPHSSLEGRYLSTVPTEDIIEEMVKPRVTFHGTKLPSVRSIVRHGFFLPSGAVIDGNSIEPRRPGIYSSHSASYAMYYADGQEEMTPLGVLPSMRLFVCATVMGRTYVNNRGSKPGSVHGPLISGYDSHFNGEFEWITHTEAAILPVYVMHIDLGSEEALRSIKATQLDPAAAHEGDASPTKQTSRHRRVHGDGEESAGDRKRRQLALKAAAMKWFPYGFGTATGTSFVVEDVGEVSEDEEEYGEWQASRLCYGPKDERADGQDHGPFTWDEEEGGLFLDQYQEALEQDMTKKNAKKKRQIDSTEM